jgi:PAS domain S-box-containing protein
MEPPAQVLIIDDDPAIRESLEAFLQDRDFHVQTAENGKVGLTLLEQEPFDIVLVDLSMPKVSGFEVLAQARKANPDLPLIVISGTGRIKDTVKALHLGATDYIIKPISDLSIVTHTIEKALESVRLKQENLRYQEHLEKLVQERTMDLERLGRAIEHVNEVVVITDTQGTIQYANTAFERITGYTQAEAIGQNPRILKSGKHDADFYRKMWETISHGSIWRGRIINKRKDGSLFYDEATITPVRNSKGEIAQYVSVKRDITQEIQLETQLRRAQKMEAIGTLAGGIAHDFNNILSAIMGFSELSLDCTRQDAEVQGYLEGVLKACARAKNLVSQILTFSRQTEGEKRPLRLQTLVKEVVNLLRASIPSTIELKYHLDSTCGPVQADSTQIHQVVMNLATNAYHAMRETGGIIEIRLEQRNLSSGLATSHLGMKPGVHAVLVVSDTGKGMKQEILDRIFEPYFTTKEPGEGTGLGLAIVHSIMESHDGSISVSSEVGKGTRFELFFPLCLPPECERIDTAAPHKPLGKERILFVDDEPAIVEISRDGLKRFGYQVAAFSNPLEALEYFRLHKDEFDVVVTDLTMPKITGIELASRIHELQPSLPILLCSGFSTSAQETQGKLVGVQEFLAKPIHPDRLGRAIRQLMEKHPV